MIAQSGWVGVGLGFCVWVPLLGPSCPALPLSTLVLLLPHIAVVVGWVWSSRVAGVVARMVVTLGVSQT